MGTSSLGAAIITKNSENTIGDCISSILPFCSQIVIVDTGSTDSTPSICQKIGAELHFFKWIDDFSKARNYGLNLLRTDWIISIDSDEQLVSKTLGNNLINLTRNELGGLSVILNSRLGSEENYTESKHRYTRIFKNHPLIKFEGRIHEQISKSILDSGFEIIETDIVIEHSGYLNNSQEKVKRNRDLLNLELINNPDDPWLKFHLAETEFSAGELEISFKLYNSIKDSGLLSVEQTQKTLLRLAQIELKRDNHEGLEKRLNFIGYNNDFEGLRKYVLGTSYLVRKQIGVAKKLLMSEEVNSSKLVDKKNLEATLNLIEILSN